MLNISEVDMAEQKDNTKIGDQTVPQYNPDGPVAADTSKVRATNDIQKSIDAINKAQETLKNSSVARAGYRAVESANVAGLVSVIFMLIIGCTGTDSPVWGSTALLATIFTFAYFIRTLGIWMLIAGSVLVPFFAVYGMWTLTWN